MGHEKNPQQHQSASGSGQFEGEEKIAQSKLPPKQLFADPNSGGAGIVQRQDTGGDGSEVKEEGGSSWEATWESIFGQFQSIFGGGESSGSASDGDGAKQLAGSKEGGQADAATELAAEKDPPNQFVQATDRDTHKISDAVKEPLNAAIDEVQSLTGIDIGTGFGDTTRELGAGTKKVGADNFSWHKSGRAVDFNQGLKWVIAKDPSGNSMYFRLYLEANDTGAASAYAKTFTEDEKKNLHFNAMGANVTKKPVVDVTAILEKNGFERIPAHDGWESSYNKREWWHYVKDDGLTWYQALRQIYTDEQIVTAMKKLVVDRHSSGGRLGRREGFPPETLKAIWDNTAVTLGKLGLYFSVGSNSNCANIPEDVAAVKAALVGLGIPENADVSVMISAYQVKKGATTGDGYITVGGGTHGKIGAEMK